MNTREARWQQFFGHDVHVTEAARPSPEVLLEIRRQRPTDRELAEADDAVLQAERRYQAADAALRQAFAEKFHVRKRVAVTKLARILLAARAAEDELVQVEEDEQNTLGPQVERLSSAWSTVMSGSKTFEPLLDAWLASARTYGLLDQLE